MAMVSARSGEVTGDTYWDEERFGWMIQRLAEGPGEQDEASEDGS